MMMKRFFADTLRLRLSIYCVLLVICATAATGWASASIARQTVRDNTIFFGQRMLAQTAYRLGNMVENANAIADKLIINSHLNRLLQDLSAEDPAVQQRARIGLNELLVHNRYMIPGSVEILIINDNGLGVSDANLTPDVTRLVHGSLAPGEIKCWQLRYLPGWDKKSYTDSAGRLLELTARIIKLPGRGQSGYIILRIDYREIESIMYNISFEEMTLNRFASNAVVFGPDKQVIFPWISPQDAVLWRAYSRYGDSISQPTAFNEQEDDGEYLIVAAPVRGTPWQVYIDSSTTKLYAGLERINRYVFFIGLSCALAGLLLSAVVSLFVTRPLDRLRRVMRKVEDGDFAVRVPEQGPSEVYALSHSFNLMLSEVDILTRRLVAEEGERKAATIRVLQNQIAPHFLFNTLSALAGMTRLRPSEEVAEALRSLKKLLYLSIGKENDLIKLSEEFEHIHHYLYLMKIRYPGRFTSKLELPKELRDCLILRLVLQPLVENAIKHGLGPRGGCVQIAARAEGRELTVEVADNGKGMREEQLEALWRREATAVGIGIRNVDERLKLTFGPDYGLSVESGEGKGTVVLLRVPLRHAAESDFDKEVTDQTID